MFKKSGHPVPSSSCHRPLYRAWHADNSKGGHYGRRTGDVTMKKVILDINDRTFDSQVLQSDKPVLVDFWAPWCGPCNSIEPVIEKLAEVYGHQFRFTRCNVDHNPKTPDRYGIKGIPTLMFFKGGNLVDKLTGLVPMSIIEDALKNCLSEPERAGL